MNSKKITIMPQTQDILETMGEQIKLARIYRNSLSLAISREDATMDFELAINTAKYYDISNEKAHAIVKEIKAIVSGETGRTLQNNADWTGAQSYA